MSKKVYIVASLLIVLVLTTGLALWFLPQVVIDHRQGGKETLLPINPDYWKAKSLAERVIDGGSGGYLLILNDSRYEAFQNGAMEVTYKGAATFHINTQEIAVKRFRVQLYDDYAGSIFYEKKSGGYDAITEPGSKQSLDKLKQFVR